MSIKNEFRENRLGYTSALCKMFNSGLVRCLVLSVIFQQHTRFDAILRYRQYVLFIYPRAVFGWPRLSVCQDFGDCVLLLVCCPTPVGCVGPAWLW